MARSTNPQRDVLMIVALTAAIVVPAVLTMNTIVIPQSVVEGNTSSPLGYTVSLTLFLVPVLVTGYWVIRHSPHKVHVRALLAAAGSVFTLGCFLDFAFGYHFFSFPNPDATLGLRLPAWNWSDRSWVPGYLPIEEFGFYSLGSLFMLVMYIWSDHEWLRDYDPLVFRDEAQKALKLLTFRPWLVVGAAALIGLAILFKKYGNHSYQQGFPSYFTFQVILLFLPTVFLYDTVRRFINWRAFAFTFFLLLMIALLWEATLAIPYGWWDYKPDAMLGVTVLAWSHLPLEAVLLWLVAAWGTVFCYEFFRILFHMDRSWRAALFGLPAERPESEPLDG